MALPQIQIGDGMIEGALLSSVEVVQELNQHWWCTVVCRNTEDQRIAVEEMQRAPRHEAQSAATKALAIAEGEWL